MPENTLDLNPADYARYIVIREKKLTAPPRGGRPSGPVVNPFRSATNAEYLGGGAYRRFVKKGDT